MAGKSRIWAWWQLSISVHIEGKELVSAVAWLIHWWDCEKDWNASIHSFDLDSMDLLNCLQLQMEYWRNVQWLRSEEPWAPFELPHTSAYLKPHSILQQGPVKWRLKHIRYVPFTRNKCSFTAKAVMWGLKIKRPGEDARFLISIVGDCVCKSFRDIGPTTATLIKLVNMAFGYSQWQLKKRPTLNLQADYS